MAEIAGAASAAAGLLSLGLQLTENAQKLQHFYSLTKNAPEHLTDLIHETETLILLLQQVDCRRFDFNAAEGVALARCVTTCSRAAKRLHDITAKLSAASHRSKVRGSLYTAFKEHDLEACCRELDRARGALSFAFQLYESAHQRRMLANIESIIGVQGIAQEPEHPSRQDEHQLVCTSTATRADPPSKPPSVQIEEATNLAWSGRFEDGLATSRELHRKRHHYRLTFPSWILSRVWDIIVARSISGWTMSIVVSSHTEGSTELSQAIDNGDLQGVRRLIESGRASPTDTWIGPGPRGDASVVSALLAASWSGSAEICALLLQYHTFADEEMASACSAYLLYRSSVSPLVGLTGKMDMAVINNMYKAFFQIGRLQIDLSAPRSASTSDWVNHQSLLDFCPTRECFHVALQDSVAFPSYRLSTERFSQASSILEFAAARQNPQIPFGLEERLNACLWACGRNSLDGTLAMASDYSGTTLLHKMARMLGSPRFSDAENCYLVQLMRDIIQQGAQLHHQDIAGETPFDHFLWELRFTGIGYDEQLRRWAQALADSGVALSVYGREESRLWSAKNQELCDSGIRPYMRISWGGKDWYMVGFEYGSEPVLWKCKWADVEIFSCYELEPMPGSWPNTMIPRRICWDPGLLKGEGHWKTIAHFTVSSEAKQEEKIGRGVNPQSEFERMRLSLLRSPQDDAGPIAVYLGRRKGSSYKRSRSQPPSRFARIDLGSCGRAQRYHAVQGPIWLPRLQMCLEDGRYRFGCFSGRMENPTCISGSHSKLVPLPLREWYIFYCRDPDYTSMHTVLEPRYLE